MKTQIDTSDGILGGRSVQFTIKLEDGVQSGTLSVDALGFSRAAVQGIISGSGRIKVGQRNFTGGEIFPTVNTFRKIPVQKDKPFFDIFYQVSGRYLVLDLSEVNFEDKGVLDIVVVLKN